MTFTKEHTLEQFIDWWTNSREIRPPFKGSINVTDIATAICLYRSGPFQVELYICKPNTASPLHSHDGVEFQSVYMTGDLQFTKDGENYADLSQYQYAKPDGTHALFGKTAEVNFGRPHAVRIGATGGSFMIFEKWHDREPSSVAVEYNGETVGEKHDTTIANSKLGDGGAVQGLVA